MRQPASYPQQCPCICRQLLHSRVFILALNTYYAFELLTVKIAYAVGYTCKSRAVVQRFHAFARCGGAGEEDGLTRTTASA